MEFITVNETTTASNVSWSDVLQGINSSKMKQFADAFVKPSGVISLIAASFGIIFNILNIIVLSHPKMRNAVNLLLTMMTASELALLIIYIPYVVIFSINYEIGLLPRFFTTDLREARYMLFYSDASIIFHLSASWLIIATACFRFIYVQFPLRSGRLCSYNRAVLAGITTILACAAIAVPNMMLNKVVTSEFPCREPTMCSNNTITIYYVHSYNEGRYAPYFEHFNFWLFAVCGKFIPGILLFVFTIFLIRVLREANQRKKRLHSDAGVARQKQHSSSSNEHSQTARMLLAVVILFFFIEFPHGVLLAYSAATEDFSTYDHLGEVIDMATIIAFSLNLILYSAMSRQYRKLFYEIFIRRLVSKLRFTKFRAKYKRCSVKGHNEACVPATTETCALSVTREMHTVHTNVPSDESEDQNLIEGEQKHYMNNSQ